MASTNKILAVAVVLLLVVAIASLLVDRHCVMFQMMGPICDMVTPDLFESRSRIFRVTPPEEGCNNLKPPTTTEVSCTCQQYSTNSVIVSIAGITTKCGVFDKYKDSVNKKTCKCCESYDGECSNANVRCRAVCPDYRYKISKCKCQTVHPGIAYCFCP